MSDNLYMSRAIQLAQQGLFTTDPNPRVGSVLVKDGAIVAEGWHQKAGSEHAEIHVLQIAGEKAKDATLYVTLEPCSHYGKTPPCADALIRAGVAKVVVAGEDPNPAVSGKGVARLREAGIEVITGVMQQQAEQLNPGFMMRMRHGRPYVRCKMAMSLDGCTAMSSGESQWITSEAARHDTQLLRARSSAVMTGIGTVLADNPRMNVRLDDLQRMPAKLVLDPHLSISPDAKILQTDGKTYIVTATDEPDIAAQLEQKGAEIIYIPNKGSDCINLRELMHTLAQKEMNEIHMEAGATLNGSMLQEGLIDELIIYMAPKLMGSDARGLFNTPWLQSLSDAVNLKITDIRAVGVDWRITALVQQ